MAFSFDLKIVRAKNIDIKSNEFLFVRCYLCAGNNNRIKLDTDEILSSSPLFWNQIFSLECSGNRNIYNTLCQSPIVFELRKRVSVPLLGKISKSILLGRAEVPWKSISETKGMEIEKWVFMSLKKKWMSEDVKPLAVQLAIKLLRVLVVEETSQEKRRRVAECRGKCRCNSCGSCDMYASVEACQAF